MGAPEGWVGVSPCGFFLRFKFQKSDYIAIGLALAVIVILTLLFLAIILSTQFSLGRMFSSATRVSRSRRERLERSTSRASASRAAT